MALSLSAPALLLYRLGEKAGIAEFSASSFEWSFLVRSVRGRAAAPRAKVKRVAMLGVSSLGPPAIKVALLLRTLCALHLGARKSVERDP